MLEDDHRLNLELDRREDRAGFERLERKLEFIASTVAEVRKVLPMPRRELSESTRRMHIRATWERRSGWCPCCSTVRVCDGEARLPGSEWDHWAGRWQNGVEATWLVCSTCNRLLEIPAFKAAARPTFEAYQIALRVFLPDLSRDDQQSLFE